jgi:pyruvate dehydrogenase E2 component (dihydrolipoamide acetyltransferase)
MITFTLPELGENISAGTVIRVLVEVGDAIARDQGVVELDTDKATVEVPSTVSGVVQSIHVRPGDTVAVGMSVLVVDGELTLAVPAQAVAASRPERDHKSAIGESIVSPPVRDLIAPASPRIHRLAREIGVDVHEVSGSGAEGRITQHDVKEYAARAFASAGGVSHGGPTTPLLQDLSKWGKIERQPMSSVRRATAVHLARAWSVVPHITQVDKADITELEAIRKRLAPDVNERGGKLTMTVILVKVLASAVREFPQFNAVVDMAAEEIVFRRYVNVGVAVDTFRGLLVPVVRDADRKGLTEIAIEIQSLADRARDRKLTLDDMSGGGISISNLGGLGGAHFTPIVNWPEVAILGVSRGVMEPVYIDGGFEPRLMLPLSLSYDHRLIDGADGIRFLRWIVETLEKPFRLALMG